MLTKTKICSV